MLARVLVMLVAASSLVVAAPSPRVFAEGDQNCWSETDPVTGEVKLVCEEPGDGGGDGSGDPDGSSSSCAYKGKDVPCVGPTGSTWSSAHGCYVGEVHPDNAEMTPQPGQSKEDGAWHLCYFPPPGSSWEPIWIENGTVTIDPVVLAQRAIASMDLDPITIGIVPESGPNRIGLVGLPVWMWVEAKAANTWGPITRSASKGAVSVSATAEVSSIVWDMGGGTKVTCSGPGTRYEDRHGKEDSPTCGHRYELTSDDQPDGTYQITATSHWIVEWSGGGQSGTIELDLTTDPLPIRIGEAQVLTQ